MKRLFADRPDWKRILERRFYCSFLETPDFTGHITLLCLDKIREPLIVDLHGQPVCVVNHGYQWLQQFPANEHFAVTTMFDANQQVVQWYVDICLQTGVDPRSKIPWLDDLYLDLVITPKMEVELRDADELQEARESGEITAAEYELAWDVANRLMEQIAQNKFALLTLSETHRRMLENL